MYDCGGLKGGTSVPQHTGNAHLHAQLAAVGREELLRLPPDLLRQLAAGRQDQRADHAAHSHLWCWLKCELGQHMQPEPT